MKSLQKYLPALILLTLGLKCFAGDSQAPSQTDQLPEIVSDGFVLFEGNESSPPIIVHSGDIALREEDYKVALGTYPVPKSFSRDIKSKAGGNWSYFRDILQFVSGPVAYMHLGLGAILHKVLYSDIKGELGNAGLQESVPENLRITPEKFKNEMMGNFKPIHLDLFEANSPEARAHANIKGFKANFYKYDMLLERDKLDDLVHYYPGTSFVSHAGIISVEMENGKPHLYVYDSYPKDDSHPGFPGGIEKLTPSQFFGKQFASYGVIVRPTEGTADDHANAAKGAWALLHKEASRRKGNEDLFDGEMDWRQDDSFSCAALVWRAYIEGAHMDVISDLNMILIPKWVIKKLSKENQVALNLQIAPQSFLLSTKTDRIVDFDSVRLDSALTAVSKDEPALALPSKNERSPDTGHPYWSAGDSADH